MPAETRGSVYPTRGGYGIRWPEDGKRRHRSGFATKREARRWFADTVEPRLRTGAPSAELTFDEFIDLFLSRHGGSLRSVTRCASGSPTRVSASEADARRARTRERRHCGMASVALGHVAVPQDARA